MNWAQFKDPVSQLCLAGTVVASYTRGGWVASLSPFTAKPNIFVTKFSTFSKNIRENSIVTEFFKGSKCVNAFTAKFSLV